MRRRLIRQSDQPDTKRLLAEYGVKLVGVRYQSDKGLRRWRAKAVALEW